MRFDKILEKILASKGNAFFYTPNLYDDSKSFLFLNPITEVSVSNKSDLKSFFEELDSINSPAYVMLKYEFGFLLEEKLNRMLSEKHDILGVLRKFNVKDFVTLDSDEIEFDYMDYKEHKIENYKLDTSFEEFSGSVNKVKKHISEGDTYQVNYTTGGTFDLKGDVHSLLFDLIFNQSGKYIALINDFPNLIISVSPELFFAKQGTQITARPMKGTIRRGKNISEDLANKEELKESEKDRAENIMIVDLLRNDLGRISEFETVNTELKYAVEKYESVFQLTSTINANLKTDSIVEVIRNIFPCGSITGAPKIRTMEIINEIEKNDRGYYTGTIGLVKEDYAVFNVPIRTIEVNLETMNGRIGLGSGIVWDSDVSAEYEEIKTKSLFLTNPDPYFEIFETILIENGEIFLRDYHLNRLKEAADYFLFKFDSEKLTDTLDRIIDKSKENKFIIKIGLSKWGRICYSKREPLKQGYSERVVLSDKKINSGDKFQYFKTTNRKLYDSEYEKARKSGFYDSIFLNENGDVAEGSITNIAVLKGDKYYTPPVGSGILNGCYRQYWLDSGNELIEKKLTLNEVINADKLILFNSVRKIILISELHIENKIIKYFNDLDS